jgi:hypothetical protein
MSTLIEDTVGFGKHTIRFAYGAVMVAALSFTIWAYDQHYRFRKSLTSSR